MRARDANGRAESRAIILSRRGLLQSALIAGTALAEGGTLGAMPNSGPCLRFAHLTDMHVMPGDASAAGYAAALRSLEGLDPAPEFVITGGDHIRCALQSTAEDAARQWDAYDGVLRGHPRWMIRPVLGNHDILGWGLPAVPRQQPGDGKVMALNRLKLDRGYYCFDAGGWHFVILDNIAYRPGSYYGGLDEAQFVWLKADLAGASAKRLPICVISHIPLLAACVFFDGKDRVREDHYHVPDAWMHRDVKPLLLLLREHGVRLCISGHIHLVDRVEYLGMTFICDGAVSGNWWAGPYQEFPEGYGVFDLWPDGAFRHEYRSFGWRLGREALDS